METTEKQNESPLGLSAPWITAYREIVALFGEDPDITIGTSETSDGPTVTLRVKGDDKANAIAVLLPSEYVFGNVKLRVKIVPANDTPSVADTLRVAFAGNPVLKEVRQAERGVYGSVAYAIFRKEVVQFFNDELNDPSGNRSTLFADIADRLIPNHSGAFFATASE